MSDPAAISILLAPDKFKGSLPASGVAEFLARGFVAALPGCTVDSLPVADGGEGTVEAALAAGYSEVTLTATGPLGDPVETRYALLGDRAVIEMAAVTGLEMIEPDVASARGSTSRGLGEVLAHALGRGARHAAIGVGGSASTDGGAGMLAALGARLVGPAGELADGGSALADIASVDLTGLDPALSECRIVLASDVDNPLRGEHGAAAVYGPQKGATPAVVAELDAALGRWVEALTAAGISRAAEWAETNGAGAAGGAGYACLLLGAQRRAGIDVVLEIAGFDDRVRGVDLVVTGEGSLDAQSLHGKAPVGVAEAAARHGVRTIAVCGRSLLDAETALSGGLAAVYALTSIEPDVSVCINDAGRLLETLAAQIAAEQIPGL